MSKILTKKVEAMRQKAVEMVGKKIEVQISHKALSIDEDKKTATFVMSTTGIDRHGDVIDQNSWIMKYFEENPVFFWQHKNYNFPLGSWEKVWFEADPEHEGEMRMVGTARFDTDIDETADRAFKHVVRGNLRMVSVGFIPHRVEYDETKDVFVLYDCELLECSLVGIGSNRQALIKGAEDTDAKKIAIEAAKALDIQIKKANNNVVIAHLKARDNLYKAIRRLS